MKGDFLAAGQSDFQSLQQTVISQDKARATMKKTMTGVKKANPKFSPTKPGGWFHR
jgi:hypothetical protein